MLIKVKTLTGQVYDIQVDPLETIESLKLKIEKISTHAPDAQRLIFSSKQLEENRTISDYQIPDGGMLHLILRLRGC